ncbi:MAG: ABC transporter substrate-binding protein [Spirochaetes bacterium]|nr:ABC transporter substrate-binding protein [Spirochaetota bacterium]
MQKPLIFLGLIWALAACSNPAMRMPKGEIVSPRHAQGFYFLKEKDFTRLVVRRPWKDAQEDLYLVLLTNGAPIPRDIPAGARVLVPVTNLALSSSPQLAMVEALGGLDAVGAFAESRFLYSSNMRARVASGRVREAFGGASRFSPEVIASVKPDLVVADVVGREAADRMFRLSESGWPILIFAEWLEEHPLARAEWIKVFGALLGKEKEADRLFAQTENAYMHMVSTLSGVEHRPKVMLGLPYKGTWYLPGGKSYIASLIEDAGGEYLWKENTEKGSFAVALEEVFRRAKDAEVWLHTGDAKSLPAIRALDPRFASFAPFASGSVWNNDRRGVPEGGNDYHEGAVLRPHELLADFAIILHPELLGELTPKYHRKLP